MNKEAFTEDHVKGKVLDHLGLIAAAIGKLGLVERIDKIQRFRTFIELLTQSPNVNQSDKPRPSSHLAQNEDIFSSDCLC